MKVSKWNMDECYLRHEEKIGRLFGLYGRFLERHPVKILVIVIAMNCLLGLGMLRLEVESGAERLYTPVNSQASKDRDYLENIYPSERDFKSVDAWEVLILTKDRGNMLTSAFLDDIKSVDNYIRNLIFITASEAASTFTELCLNRIGVCLVSGDIFLSNDFTQNMLANNITYPIFKQTSLSSLLASPSASNGLLTSAIGVKLTYYLRSGYSDQFINAIPGAIVTISELAYSCSSALDDEIEKNIGGDILFYVLTLALMMTYASIATSRMNCNFIADRSFLGQAGVFAAVLSVLPSFGFVSLIGVKYMSIVGVIPFLIIGIGIDDVFILMSGIADAKSIKKSSVSDRIYFMMKTSGIAITITSVTDFLAFLIGASSIFISVRNFCIYIGVAVLFCYFNQMTIFSACIVIHERRIKSNRHCVACCVTTKDKESLREDGETGCLLYACAGYPPKDRRDVDSPLERYPKKLIQKIVSYLALKIMIIFCFAIYIGFSVYGAVHLRQGISLQNIVADDSFFHKYATWLEEYFRTEITLSFNVKYNQTYSSAWTQSVLTSVQNTAKKDKEIDSNSELNWLTAFKQSTLYVDTSESAFITALQTFLTNMTQYASDVVIDSTGSTIISSRFYLKTNNLKSTYDQGQMMLRMREVTDNSAIPMIVYSDPFIFFEQFVEILPSTLQTVGIAIVVIIVVTIFFMPHPTLITIIAVSLFTILLGVFGFMYYWDISLSSISMIHLVMTVGFSVDFSAHICHAYLAVDSDNRDAKVQLALDRSGGPIFNAAVSTLLGVSVLGFANSYIFKTFGKLMFLVIFIGLAHSVLLIPVILSFIGPLNNKGEDKESGETSPIPGPNSKARSGPV
ncbi:patched domain-containing protein 3-like isoform X2 [Ostrea edulis]|uniref:patched domain-containing protein 3-like isoform X2 n=1 Tax=Ostrea edulis TaxID=37623 RepID=UPI0024AF367D|nr:patched domain-containing protein 3-like isoform X2 [Ostrea edulis]XP_056011584.1 patched domain-containing protein 3-like isoform X2 [Ostrea edulis]